MLGVTPDRHVYTYTLWGHGVEAEAIVDLGRFTIRSDFTHEASCPRPDDDPRWTDSYSGQLFLGGASLGLGADVVVVFAESGDNALITPGEWSRDDFKCPFVVREAAGTVGGYYGPGAEVGAETEAYTFFRLRDGAVATGSGDGKFVQSGFGVKTGAGGVGVTVQGGFYWRRDGDGPASPDLPPPEPEPVPEVVGGDRTEAYFERDSAWLNPAARTAIRELALTYRALLEDAGSYLVLEGDASRTAVDAHNRSLSLRRMLAMYDYLHSLLSCPEIGDLRPDTALAVIDSHVMLSAYGESRPAWLGLPNDVEQPEWRKATLYLTGRHLASLGAAAVLFTPEFQDEPQDPGARP